MKIKSLVLVVTLLLCVSLLVACGSCSPSFETETSETETVESVETTNVETTNVETTDVETTNAETTNVETTDVETTEIETTEIETTETETPDTETKEPETTEPEKTEPETMEPETTETETTETETETCGHNNVVIVSEIAPTCVSAGLTEGQACADCGQIIAFGEEIPATDEHKFTEWSYVLGGGCSDQSCYIKVCYVCQKVEYSKNIPDTLHPHDFEIIVVDPTCTIDGSVTITCKNCALVSYSKIIDATGHNVKWTITSTTHEAYCRNNGCDYVVENGEHEANNRPECYNKVCTVCDYFLKAGIGHDFSGEYLTNGAIHWKECTRAGCNETADAGFHYCAEATCANETADCDVCGKTFDPENEHMFNDWYETVKRDCVNSGEEKRECYICGKTETRELDPLDHEIDENTREVLAEANCYECGIEKGTCVRCGQEVTVYTPPKHDVRTWSIFIEPTCASVGLKTGVCIRCGDEDTLMMGMIAHSWSGEYQHDETHHWKTCTRCGKKSSYNKHSGEGVCLEQRTCSTCHEKYGEVLQHDETGKCGEPATCGRCGTDLGYLVEHAFVDGYDSHYHYERCIKGCGYKKNIEAHIKVPHLSANKKDTGSEIVYSYKFYLTCDGCNWKETLEEEKLHVHYGAEPIEGKTPTCTEEGLTWGIRCAVEGCGDILLEQQTIDPLGHDYYERVCNRCGAILYSEGLEFTSNGDGTCSITGMGLSCDADIFIPSISPNGDRVVSIGDSAFYDYKNLTSISIPSSVVSIGSSAFYNCENLTNISIPNSVTSIGENAFYGCSKIHVIENGITYVDKWLIHCERTATNVVLRDDIQGVSSRAFYGCTSLIYIQYDNALYLGSDTNPYLVLVKVTDTNITSCEIHNDTKIIYASAFSGCKNLISITFAQNSMLTSIGNSDFSANSMLTSIGKSSFTKNSKLTNIGKSSFAENGMLTSIGKSAFDGCTSLTNITIPNGVVSIGDYAFRGCEGLSSISIPDSVISIGSYAFTQCYNLAEITIGNNVSVIGEFSFLYCWGLNRIVVRENNTNYHSSGDCLIETQSKMLIVGSNNSVIPSDGSVIRIHDCAFYNCNTLERINIPDSITSIGKSAFRSCESLVNVDIGESSQLSIVEKYAFYYCSSLESINIPNKVKIINDYTFDGCSKLATVNFIEESQLSIIGYNAFAGCRNLKSITIPSSVICIEHYAFYNSGLTDITIEENSKLQSIDPVIFHNVDDITRIVMGEGNAIYHTVDNCIIETKTRTLVMGCTNSIIPSDGSVTTIGDYAFVYGSAFTSITIPNTVTSIGSSAFEYCKKLTNITIPASVTSIGDYAFYNCTRLASITIPDGITYIGDNAFYDCTSLTYNEYDNAYYLGSVTNPYMILIDAKDTNITSCEIHDNTKFIHSIAFYGCSSLTSITIPESVTYIGDRAFQNCLGLTNIAIPKNVISIGENVFYGCSGLESIVFDENSKLTSIGSSAFHNCSKLMSVVVPDSVTSIGESAFSNCSSLNSLTLPFAGATKDGTVNSGFWYIFGEQGSVPESLNSVNITGGTSFGDSSFSGCTGLTSITLPDSLTSISFGAFSGCTSLTSITIPDSVTSIGNYAFSECSSLKSITIPAGVTSIGEYAFRNCESLTSITIPGSVTSIGDYAFHECTNLKYNQYDNALYLGSDTNPYAVLVKAKDTNIISCEIHSDTKIIYTSAFSGCSSITNINIPTGVTRIGDDAFYGCSSITNITIPEGVISIGNSAFNRCTNLTSISIPNSIISVGSYSFVGCKESLYIQYGNALYLGNDTNPFMILVGANFDITSCVIHSDTKIISDSAFSGCSRITSITIPDGVTHIGASAFENCRGLMKVTIPSSVISVGEDAFYGCTKLLSVVFSDNTQLRFIGDAAFGGCKNLTSISIPDSVTSIGNSAFNGCKKLSSVILSENSLLTSIGRYAFENCESLTHITIPKGITRIDICAFEGCLGLEIVYYAGTKNQWNEIIISEENNKYLINAVIIFNYVPEAK